MKGIIIVLSGRIASGKSTLDKSIHDMYGVSCTTVSASSALKQLAADTSRQGLQRAGHIMDDRSPLWINEVLKGATRWVTVLDCIRNIGQANIIRKMNPDHKVIHVHLDVPLEVTSKRRDEPEDAARDVNESGDNMRSLKNGADITMFGGDLGDNPLSVISRIVDCTPRVDAIIGGQYGSEGKGHIVSYLCKEYDVVIRTGGPNAGHKVNFGKVGDIGDGIFTFYHIPSCCLHNQQALAYIAPSALIRPIKLIKEIEDLEKILGKRPRLGIHPDTFVIEEMDVTVETGTVKGSIGSTAQGVGAALARRIMRNKEYRTAKDIPQLRNYIMCGTDVDWMRGHRVLLEGTQGYGLSLYHGDYPYTTSRDTGVASLLSEIGIAPSSLCQVWGVFRTYPIRVQSPEGGTSGPMRSETSLEKIHDVSKIPLEELQTTETTSTTFRKRRIAEFDLGQFHKTMRNNGITHVALTFMDYFGVENREVTSVRELNSAGRKFLEQIRVQPALISCGFDHRYILDLRG